MRLDSPGGGSTPKRKKVASPKKIAPQVTLQPKKSVSRTTSSSPALRASSTARVPSYFRDTSKKAPFTPQFEPQVQKRETPSFVDFLRNLQATAAEKAKTSGPMQGPSVSEVGTRPQTSSFADQLTSKGQPTGTNPAIPKRSGLSEQLTSRGQEVGSNPLIPTGPNETNIIEQLTSRGQRLGDNPLIPDPLRGTTDVKGLRDLPVGEVPEPVDETLPEWAERNPLSGAIQPKEDSKSYNAFKRKYDLINQQVNSPGVWEGNANNTFADFLEQRAEWAQRNLERDMRQKVDVIEEATSRLRDGEFDYLEKAMEEDPDLLDIPKMKEHFPGATPGALENQYSDMLDATASDPDAQSAVDYYMANQLKVSRNLRKYGYKVPRDQLKRKLREYESKRKESIKFFQDRPDELPDGVSITDDSGKVIGNKKKDDEPSNIFLDSLGKKKAAEIRARAKRNQEIELIQAVDSLLDEGEGSAEEVIDRELKKIKKGLYAGRGKQYRMPTPEDMLNALIKMGTVDPDDKEEMDLAELKVNNPLHPETRSLYVSFAINQGLIDGSESSEETLNKFISAPVEEWGKKETSRLMTEARLEQERQQAKNDRTADIAKEVASHVLKPIPGFSAAGQVFDRYEDLDEDSLQKAIIDKVVVDPTVNFVKWGIDKLERPLNATAAIVNEWAAMNEGDGTWLEDGNFAQRAVAAGMFMNPANWAMKALTGQGIEDSLDDISKDTPLDLTKAAGQQFFRSQDDLHYDFRHVIADAADRPGTPSYLDSNAYQTGVGITADFVLDPLNFVGVGLVRNGVKVTGYTAKTLPKALREGAEQLNKIDPEYYSVDNLVKSLNNRLPVGQRMDRRTYNAARARVLQEFAGDLDIVANNAAERIGKRTNLSLSPQKASLEEELSALQQQRASMAVDYTVGSAKAESKATVEKMAAEGRLPASAVDETVENTYLLRQELFAPRGKPKPSVKPVPEGGEKKYVRLAQEINHVTKSLEAGAKEAGFVGETNKFTKEYNNLKNRLEERGHSQKIIDRELEKFSEDYARKHNFDKVPVPETAKGNVYAYQQARTKLLEEMNTLSKGAKDDPDFEVKFKELSDELTKLESAFAKGYKEYYEAGEHLGYDLKAIARSVFKDDNFRFTNEFDELDFYEALTAGRQSVRFDPEDQKMYAGFKAQINKMNERIKAAQFKIDHGGLSPAEIEAVKKNRDQAYERRSHLWDEVNAMEGAYRIRYIQALASANIGKPVYKNQKRGEFLAKLIDRLDAEYEARNLEQHGTYTSLRNDKPDTYGDEAAHGDFELDLLYFDKTTPTKGKEQSWIDTIDGNVERLLLPDARFRDPASQYNAVRNALHKELSNELVVRPVGKEGRRGARISSIPQLNPLIDTPIPATSNFTTKGYLDREKVFSYIVFDPKTRSFGYKTPKDALPEEVQFLRDFSYSLRDVYNRTYNQLYQKEQRAAYTRKNKKKREEVEGRVYGPRGAAFDKIFPDGIDREDFIDIFVRGDEDDIFDLLGSAGAPFKIEHPISFNAPGLSASDNSRLKSYKTASTIRSFLEKELKLSREEADDILKMWVVDAMEKKWGLHSVDKRMGNEGQFDDYFDVDYSKSLDELDEPTDYDLDMVVRKQVPKRKIAQQAGEIFGNSIKATKLSSKRRDSSPEKITLSDATRASVGREAERHAKKEVFGFVQRYHKIPSMHHNARAEVKLSPTQTLRSEVMENYRAAREALEKERDALRAEKKVAKTRAEVREIDTKLKNLKTQYDDLIGEAKKSADTAVDTIKAVTKAMKEDAIIQSAHVDKHTDVDGIRFMIAGFKADMMFSPKWIERFEDMAEFPVLKQFMDSYRKTFQPPSQALGGGDMALAFARYTNNTPEIIRQNLEMLAKSMSRVRPDNRKFMLDHFRATRNTMDKAYTGPDAELYRGVEEYLNHIESAFNRTNPSFLLADKSNYGTDFLTIEEINRYLPVENKMDLSVLRIKGAGNITINDIFNSMASYRKKNNIGQSYDKALDDPFRFGHVMALALEQSMANRALKNALIDTFGIRRAGTFDRVATEGGPKAHKFLPKEESRIERLKDLGWETIPALGNSAYFPKETATQINKLIKLTEDPRSLDEFAGWFDEVTGMWKSMQTIYNPGWYVRNGVGEFMASWLAGVNGVKPYRQAMKVIKYRRGMDVEFESLTKHYPMLKQLANVNRPVKKNDVIFTFNGKNIGPADIEVAYRDMGLKSGFIHNDLRRGAKQMGVQMDPDKEISKVGNVARKVNHRIQNEGEDYEDFFRMAHFIDAIGKSKAKSFQEAAKHAAAEVRRAHFDYRDFNSFEKAALLRPYPFYKWTRKSVPFFTSMLFMKPGKMMAAPKAMTGISGLLSNQDVYSDENGFLPNYEGMAPAWVSDLFAYQTNEIENEPGYNNYFRLPLPQMDYLAFMHEPQGAAVSMLNPMIKAPVDMAMSSTGRQLGNLQMFGGADPGEIAYGALQDSEYRRARDIGPVDGLWRYLAKYSPVTDSAAKIQAHHDKIYGEEQKNPKNGLMQIATKLGIGMYQAFPQDDPSGNVNSNVVGPANPPAVGGLGLPEVPMSSGRKAAEADPKYELASLLAILEGNK